MSDAIIVGKLSKIVYDLCDEEVLIGCYGSGIGIDENEFSKQIIKRLDKQGYKIIKMENKDV